MGLVVMRGAGYRRCLAKSSLVRQQGKFKLHCVINNEKKRLVLPCEAMALKNKYGWDMVQQTQLMGVQCSPKMHG